MEEFTSERRMRPAPRSGHASPTSGGSGGGALGSAQGRALALVGTSLASSQAPPIIASKQPDNLILSFTSIRNSHHKTPGLQALSTLSQRILTWLFEIDVGKNGKRSW